MKSNKINNYSTTQDPNKPNMQKSMKIITDHSFIFDSIIFPLSSLFVDAIFRSALSKKDREKWLQSKK